MRRLAAIVSAMAVAVAAVAAPADEESDEQQIEPEYAAGKTAIEARDWPAAIRLLSSAALRDTRNADIQNYLGFAYRSTGELSLAFNHYNRALLLNPRHRGAHEYLGEAYLMIGNAGKAEEHLAALEKICLLACEEFGQLQRKLAEYRAQIGR